MNVVVLGAGAWGTAMTVHLARQGHTVTLVSRRMEEALELAEARENRARLEGVRLAESVQIGHEVRPVLMEAEVVLLACPSTGVAEWCERMKPFLPDAWRLKLVVVLCKGLEKGTFRRPSEVVAATLGGGVPVGVLSGPTYAREVAEGFPTAITLATTAPDGPAVQEALSGPSLRVYLSEDVAGVEFAGSLKNVYAIAAGICDGLKLGDNAKAALLTRALAEMTRLGTGLGGQSETFAGLSGFGDLLATCTGLWSRNRTFGQGIGEGKSPDELLASSAGVVEGYASVENYHGLCEKLGIEAPILSEIHAVLYTGKDPKAALHDLMSRDLKRESVR